MTVVHLAPRAWEQVIGALLRLGCQVLHEDEWHVHVIRGAMVIQPVPKCLVSPDIQRRILSRLGIAELDYFAKLHAD